MFAVACCFGGVNSVGLHDSCLNNLVVCRRMVVLTVIVMWCVC